MFAPRRLPSPPSSWQDWRQELTPSGLGWAFNEIGASDLESCQLRGTRTRAGFRDEFSVPGRGCPEFSASRLKKAQILISSEREGEGV